ncbi:DUF1049 domain-containing protein [candidate division WOR-3 bacterium]|nr:DUF1049 domain-containing protein [candidate division WOR-3 bacterium]
MVTLRVILILVAFVVLLVIAVQNSSSTTDVWFGRRFLDAPLSIVMLYSFAFGAACVGVFTLISEIRLRSRLRRQRREVEALTEELRAFRNAPLEAPAQPATAPAPETDHVITGD